MKDFNQTIKPNTFNGEFFTVAGTIAVGGGWSVSNTTLGDVFSEDYINIGFVKGGDISMSMTLGTSTLIDVKWENCCP
jgi:hypothetical protein